MSALKFLNYANIETYVITGRNSPIVEKRMFELGIKNLFQGVHDKLNFIEKMNSESKILLNNTLFIGDDLNDLASMKVVRYVCCPKNSSKDVLKISNLISKYHGGEGAVRDIIESIYGKTIIWKRFVKNYK